jgi:hypothetical protein
MEIKKELDSKFKLEVHNDAPEKFLREIPPYQLFRTQGLQLSSQLCRLFFNSSQKSQRRITKMGIPIAWNGGNGASKSALQAVLQGLQLTETSKLE